MLVLPLDSKIISISKQVSVYEIRKQNSNDVIAAGILQSDVTHWLSPDERHLAYICVNVTGVPIYRFPVYGSADNIYATVDNIRYPKVHDRLYEYYL